MTSFLITNGYLKDRTQKGFLPNVAGCIEHSATLTEALRDARKKLRTIVVNWIDLANAFGSVRHNLILFALDWYHVPKWCHNMIQQYYSSLFAQVVTKKWKTSFFPFHIGVFQGCTVSPILFDTVYQICLDFTEQYGTDPYVFSSDFNLKAKYGQVELLQLAYADDHTTINRSIAGAQSSLDLIQEWLGWTKCMRAKPIKCKCLALAFDAKSQSYGQLDPNLKIGQHKVKDIAQKPFKFLGRFLEGNLKDKSQAEILFIAFRNT